MECMHFLKNNLLYLKGKVPMAMVLQDLLESYIRILEFKT